MLTKYFFTIPALFYSHFTKSKLIIFRTKNYYISPIFYVKFLNSVLLKNYTTSAMETKLVVQEIERIIPPKYAESWDNTGLLIEANAKVSTALLTNDLTEKVLQEALSLSADLIITYHPLIFAPLKRITQDRWQDRVVTECIKKSISVYSPHTACDAIQGGVNDWLILPFDFSHKEPIKKCEDIEECYIDFHVNRDVNVIPYFSDCEDCEVKILRQMEDQNHMRVNTNSRNFIEILKIINAKGLEHILPIDVPTKPNVGMGRIGTLEVPMTLDVCIEIVKQHLKLKSFRLALGVGHSLDTKIKTIACCAGSGASILKLTTADVFITGEMSHHELLEATHRNVSVVLCEHSNSERGYLEKLAKQLAHSLPFLTVKVSAVDCDPVSVI